MNDTLRLFRFDEKSPLLQLIISLGIIIGVGIFLFSALILAGILIFHVDLSFLENPYSASGEKDLAFLRFIVIAQDVSIFIVPSVIILILLSPVGSLRLQIGEAPPAKDIVFVIILTFCLFPVNSFTGQLNSMMHLPDWLSGVEQWMMTKEEDIGDLVNLLIDSKTFWVMILNLIIIAIIPAIGEELLFRGVFQRISYKLFRSGHIAVWVTGFLFSAIHFQFYGFIPRFILGLIFGYLFLWSKALWLPIISHFINNAVPVAGAYVQEWDKINIPPVTGLGKQLIFLPVPLIIIIVILLYFRNKSRKETENRRAISQI